MEDFVILDGDMVQFMPNFGAAIVTARPGLMRATPFPPMVPGNFTVNGKVPCVEGDEQMLQVPGCPYIAGPYTIPGVGTLKIHALSPNQYSQKTRIGTKRLLVKGAMFQARFEVQAPAMQPGPGGAPIPDPMPMHLGMATFVTTNTTKRVP